jgi:thiol reductant ABC exporter CydC subunit
MRRAVTARLAAATLLGAGAAGAGIGLLATASWLIVRASQQPNVAALGLAIVGVRFFGVSRGVLRYGERLVGHDAALRALAGLRVRIYRKLERLAPAGLEAFRSGDLLARLVDDVDSLQDLLLRVVQPYLITALVGALTVGMIWWLLPSAGLLLLVTLLLNATVVPLLSRRLARRSEAHQAQARGELSTAVVDVLQGAPDLIANGATTQVESADHANDELTRVARAAARTAGIGAGLITLLTGIAVWGALIVGIPAVSDGVLGAVALSVVALVPLAAFELVAGLPQASATLERVRRSRERVDAVLQAEPPMREPAVPLPLPAAPYSIRLRRVSARHHVSGRRALDGIDLDLQPGCTTAVVGPSGAGKSTLAAVLVRFLDISAGSVTLNGVPLSDLDGNSVRRVIGLVGQDAHVFDCTIADNLRLACPGAADAALRDVLAHAKLLDWVESLPNGMETEVGEHGARLSGGQRQRLVVARALLADFPVLIFDEPAEHLDTATADALTADLLAAASGRTTLLITHRLTRLRTVDQIVVLEEGRLVECGAHAELVAAGGAYAAMWAREQETG